jgi:hypothetical protein
MADFWEGCISLAPAFCVPALYRTAIKEAFRAEDGPGYIGQKTRIAGIETATMMISSGSPMRQ